VKLFKTTSEKKNLKMSQKEWQMIGKKAGWIKSAQSISNENSNTKIPSINWIITRDFASSENGEGNDVGKGNEEILKRNNKTKFKMYDDDDVLYYEGFMIENGGEELFNPLDDFGMPNAGCTRIDILSNGQWEQV
jgi:hypothetical protein